MSNKTRKHARMLVQNILNQNLVDAQSLFKKLIMQAQQQRQKQAAKQAGVEEDQSEKEDQSQQEDNDSEQTDDIEVDEFEDSEQQSSDEDDESSDGESGESEDQFTEQPQISDEETTKLVDDQIQINCNINAAVLEELLNTVAQLKSQFEGMNIDKHSRKYFEIKVPIQYYSEKLQELQNQTNPGVDQEQVKKKLDDISSSLQQLKNTISGDFSSDDQIKTPSQVNADEGIADQMQQEGQTEQTEQTDQTDEQQSEQQSEQTDKQQQEDQEDVFS